MASSIPPSFLKELPQNATLRPLDFQHTTPPIPAYKDHFAAIIDHFLSPSECTQLLSLAEQSTTTNTNTTDATPTPQWDRAMVNISNNKQIMATDTRNCGRIVWDSPVIAERLLARLQPFLQRCGIDTVREQPLVTGIRPVQRGEVFRVSGLNERLRFLKYEGGEYFRPHGDGNYFSSGGRERSLFTIHLYLNGDGVQDLKELGGKIEEAERDDGLFERDDGESGREVDVNFGEAESESDSQSKPVSEIESEPESENKNVESNRAESGAVGTPDSGGLLGGATSFIGEYDAKDAVRVFPKAGSVLIFQQRNLIHGGDDVFRGVKYTMRTDVMYEQVE